MEMPPIVGYATPALFCLILWAILVPGYVVWIRWFRRVPQSELNLSRTSWPPVDVIVAVHNEIRYLEGKIADLQRLQYPSGRVRFWIVDGASCDGTAELAERLICGDARFVILRLPLAHKASQLNAALRLSRGAWVLVTDADARLAPETLMKLVAAGEAEAEVAVIGTPVKQIHAYPLDQLHWEISDHLRMVESERGFSSIVTAPCYLFRRGLFDSFPGDGYADDVYTAFSAAVAGRRVRYVEAATVELRSPLDFPSFLRHKLRKVNNYLIEVFRFLPKALRMPAPARWIFMCHAAQMTIAPVLFASALLFLTRGLIIAGGTMLAPSTLVFMGGVLAVIAWLIRRRFLLGVLGLTMNGVLLIALILYPIHRLTRAHHGWRLPEGPPRDSRSREGGIQHCEEDKDRAEVKGA
jgi:cellulose synthase/poly-beta-1,6-N-acetylglucosamine synthase-like glycosyltransferase